MFFLQFAEFNLKAPPYSKTLMTQQLLYSRLRRYLREFILAITKRINLSEIIMQGTVWGSLLCTNSMDKLGKLAY